MCHTYERFSTVAMALGKMVIQLARSPLPDFSSILFAVVSCGWRIGVLSDNCVQSPLIADHRLSENERALQALTQCLPDQLKDNTFKEMLEQDRNVKNWHRTLLKNLSGSP